MIFRETLLPGVLIIDTERLEDERGFFARTFAEDEFAARGLRTAFDQCSVSYNGRSGTLRGMHFQRPPHQEAKLIRCTAGAVFDVAVDLRSDSPSFRCWVGVELTADNRRMMYIPEGVAHGYQTLADGAELFYQISGRYEPSSAAGVRWNDPAFAISWPAVERRIMSPRDRDYPDFTA